MVLREDFSEYKKPNRRKSFFSRSCSRIIVHPLESSSSPLPFCLPNVTRRKIRVLFWQILEYSRVRVSIFDGPTFLGSMLLFYVETPALYVYSCWVLRPSLPPRLSNWRVCALGREREREKQTGYLNLLVVLSKSPPTWSDVNTSGW